MKFLVSIVFPVLLGFLFSCSAGQYNFSSTQKSSAYHTLSPEKHNSDLIDKDNTDSSLQEEPVYASAEATSLLTKPTTYVGNLKISTDPQQAGNETDKVVISGQDISKASTTAKKRSDKKAFGIFPENMHKLAVVALACGILAFAPFVLSLSLLYAIPFAIAGVICGRIAMRDLRTNRMRKGIALAKAGFLMSAVVAVILVLLGALALFG